MRTAPTTTKKPKVAVRKLPKGYYGLCWSDGTIHIRKGLRWRSHLNTLIHECLHHFNWNWSEAKVRTVSKHLTEILIKHRFRRIEPY
jgi:hypothetical protein